MNNPYAEKLLDFPLVNFKLDETATQLSLDDFDPTNRPTVFENDAVGRITALTVEGGTYYVDEAGNLVIRSDETTDTWRDLGN
ncbi:hypothetical protein HYV12_02915 [Candidatus Dojkabacteria bacterium]|nr:hypothetical protein [Candidatus Dojkabacteria bacterium]